MTIFRRFWFFLTRWRRMSDLDEEMRLHLELRAAANRRGGLAPDEATREARRRFGSPLRFREQSRETWGWLSIEAIAQDARYGWRQLRQRPSFTVVAVLILALGIGANTAIFGAVEAVLLRPLPFRAPDQLVRVKSVRLDSHGSGGVASYPDFADWRARNHVFAGLAAFTTASFTLSGRGDALHIPGAIVSTDLFSLLGVQPALGRTFRPEEDRSNGTGGLVVIMSHRIWVEQFAANPHIINQTIDLDSHPFTVIGIMPAGFQFPLQATDTDFWTTMAVVPLFAAPGRTPATEQRGAHFLDVIGRLKPRISRAQAQQEMQAIAGAINTEHPENAPRTVGLVSESQGITRTARPILLILLAAVGCVLLMACGSVANLMLARAASRQHEMVVRRALGAARGRLVRQLLVESLLLAGLGGALGTAFAFWGFRALAAIMGDRVPRLAGADSSGAMLAFTLLLSLATGVLFGLMPALQISRIDLLESLKDAGRSLANRRQQHRTRGMLVIVNVAVAVVLLMGAALLIQSLWRLQRVNPGFDPHDVLTFRINLPKQHYGPRAQTQFFDRALTRLDRLPGVRSASAVMPLPIGDAQDSATASFNVEGRPATAAERPVARYSWVDPGYFHTLRIPLRAGRDFSPRDDLQTTPVAIVNEALVKRFFPGGHAMGARIRPGINSGYDEPPMREIVGIVADVKGGELADPAAPHVYAPLAQSPRGDMIIVVRTASDPASLVPAMRKAVAAMDPNLPIYDVRPLEEYVEQSVVAQRAVGLVLGLFAALALALAAIGLYGVVSYSTAERTHEIGLRMALGAERRDVVGLVVGQGFRLTAIGVAIGIVGALMLTRFLTSLLYGVSATDLLTFAGVSIVLVGIALIASYLPARRAARIEPLLALRHE